MDAVRTAKSLWTRGLDRVGVYDRQLAKAAARPAWFILVYHRILADDDPGLINPELGVRLRFFRQQLAYYRAHFQLCTVADALAIQARGRRPERPLLSITFDDGYRDNATLGLPLLEAMACPATFFLCTGPIEQAGAYWWDVAAAAAAGPERDHWRAICAQLGVARTGGAKAQLGAVLAALWQRDLATIHAILRMDQLEQLGLAGVCPPAMTIEQVKELAAAGMEIAAHTLRHPNLTQESAAVVEAEIRGSKERLERWTGRPVVGFAPPGGHQDATVERVCQAEHLQYVASTERGVNEPLRAYHLERFAAPNLPLPALKRAMALALPARRLVQAA